MHDCPHPDCDLEIPFSMFACRHHWFGLPAEIRAHINRAWRKLSNGDATGITSHEAATAEALDHWAHAA